MGCDGHRWGNSFFLGKSSSSRMVRLPRGGTPGVGIRKTCQSGGGLRVTGGGGNPLADRGRSLTDDDQASRNTSFQLAQPSAPWSILREHSASADASMCVALSFDSGISAVSVSTCGLSRRRFSRNDDADNAQM